MNAYREIIIGCWLVFLLVWILSAWSAKRNTSINWGWLITRGAVILVLVLLAHVGFLSSPAAALQPLAISPLLGAIGAAFCVLGIGLAVWARLYLGRNWGMPMSHKLDPELVTTGPYALVRHPIYTGILLAILGSTVVAGPWWFVLFFASGAYFVYSAYEEEGFMARLFPDTYPAYKARTHMLIPFLW